MNRQSCCFIAVLTLLLAVFTACAPAQDAQSLRAPMTPPTAPPAGTLPVGPAQSVPTGEPVAAPSAEQANRADATVPPAADMQSLWAQLREGAGFVVLLRHAETVAGTGDPPGFRLDDCETQRNLSDVGR